MPKILIDLLFIFPADSARDPNSTFEGDGMTSPPTTAGGAGDNTLSPVLSPTSDTEHTTGIFH